MELQAFISGFILGMCFLAWCYVAYSLYKMDNDTDSDGRRLYSEFDQYTDEELIQIHDNIIEVNNGNKGIK